MSLKVRLSTLLKSRKWLGEKVILQLCADTGSDTWPYRADPAYLVITIGIDIGVENLVIDAPVHGIVANPVCTDFTAVRRGGLASPPHMGPLKKKSDPEFGMKLVDEVIRIIEACDDSLAWWAIENPATGSLRQYLGQPDYSYEPWWYGSAWTKRTALWGDFAIPPRKFQTWDDMPDKLLLPELYVRPSRPSRPATGRPGLSWQQKSAFFKIPEFRDSGMPAPTSNMELRSLCSQRFARAFKRANP